MKNFFKNIIISILYLESKFVLFLKKPKIIAITGTVGKTTTKDIFYAGLHSSFNNVRKSQKGFNSDIGVLLTILNLETHGTVVLGWLKNIIRGFGVIFDTNYPELLIIEVGANYPGEIRKNAKLLQADIVVFTKFPKIMAHMEFFKDRQEFINEKLSLAFFMKKNGVIIYNNDDQILVQEFKKSKFDNYNKKTFGKNADYIFRDISIEYQDGVLQGSRVILNNDIVVNLKGVLGEHLGYSVSALSVLVDIFELELVDVLYSLEHNFVPAAGRMRIFNGIRDSVIIDDSYNALPESIKNGSQLIKKINTKGRKIYVLGRLAELGKYTEESYKIAIKYIRESCDIIVLVNDGDIAQKYAKDLEFKRIYSFNKYGNDYFANTDEAGEFLKKYIDKKDVIIFKGARHSTGFERAIVKLIKNKDKKYLVQEHLY